MTRAWEMYFNLSIKPSVADGVEEPQDVGVDGRGTADSPAHPTARICASLHRKR